MLSSKRTVTWAGRRRPGGRAERRVVTGTVARGRDGDNMTNAAGSIAPRCNGSVRRALHGGGAGGIAIPANQVSLAGGPLALPAAA